MTVAIDVDALIAQLEATGRHRVLRAVDLGAITPPPCGSRGATRIVGVADVETTGLGDDAKIIELAIRRLRVDGAGDVVEVGRRYGFLEDPGEPLDAAISKLTGLTDADLAGRSIDETLAVRLLTSCEAVVCHNARFDAPLITARLKALAGLPFACSLHEVDWRARGFARAFNLGCLLCQAGQYSGNAHRAGADVDATIALLLHRDAGGRTAMAELLANAARPSLRLSAFGAAFGPPKDALKARGYRWDADGRVWWREVAVEAGETEHAWLDEHVYAPCWLPKAEGPHVEMVDWSNRHA